MNHEYIERFEKIQENTSKLRLREVMILLKELRREENQETRDKIKTTIRYHQYEQQQYFIRREVDVELRFLESVLRTNDPNERIVRYNPEKPNN